MELPGQMPPSSPGTGAERLLAGLESSALAGDPNAACPAAASVGSGDRPSWHG